MIQKPTAKILVDQYVTGIQSGEIKSCAAVSAAIDRYNSDLERVGMDPDFPYYLDEKAALKACTFFPAVLRHSIGKFVGQPFELSPWQAFVVWNLFGWKRNSDDTRRFRKAFVSVARKNGKSTMAAGLALYFGCADGEAGAQCYIGATKLDQARIIHQECERMLRQSPFIARRSQMVKDLISFPDTDSFIRPLGSDRPFDGLNPHACLFDELHAWGNFRGQLDFWNTMTTGSASRTQPMQIIITTAGNENSILFRDEQQNARSVIHGDLINESLFGLIYELEKDDDIHDEQNWIKANPNLGVSVSADYIKELSVEAKQKSSADLKFRRYTVNMCVSSTSGATDRNQWDDAAGPLSDWRYADAVACGVDLGGREDLAAYAFAARFHHATNIATGQPVWRYEIKARSMMATHTKRDLSEEPWRTWIHDGHIEVVDQPYNCIQNGVIEDTLAEGASIVAIDPRNAEQMLENLEGEGLTVIPMQQSHRHYNEVMLEFESALIEGRLLVPEDDPVLRWCFLNMTIKYNANNDRMPDKVGSKDKIDAAVACLMAIRAVWVAPGRPDGPLYLSG